MQTVTNEIMELEHRFWDAMKAKDAETAAAMTDDGCIIVGAQGVSAIDAKTMGTLTTDGKWKLDEFAFDTEKAQVRMVAEGIAIVAYNVKERVEVDGKTLSVDANDASVWVRRDGEWRCALHTESLAGDPFGRDKKV